MTELRQGDLLDGRYRIGPKIARGGMSTVYRALDTRLGTVVVAKVMDPRFQDDAAFRTRFEREARAVAAINDTSLVSVYDQGADSAGHVFVIMEFVNGGTLRELLEERGPMPPHAAVAVIRPVLQALALAHAHGMVHRDIKPENVLISDNGQIKLTDFGLVRAAADASVTANTAIVGTAGYLSPEQVTGAEITPASDVYATGVLLFELLTGSLPFSGDSALGIAMQRLDRDVPPPSSVIDGVPPEFDELIARACSRNPGDRFTSAAEFSDQVSSLTQQLSLPPFVVPAPKNSAAHRAAALPDDAPGTVDEEDDAKPGVTGTAVISTTEDDPTHTNPEGMTAVLPPHTAPYHTPNRGTDTDGNNIAEATPNTARQTSRRAKGRQRTRTGCILWALLALIATTAVLIGAWWVGSGRYGEVPSISGLSRQDAVRAIVQAGFDPISGEKYSDDVPAGTVAGSDPTAGSRVVRGNEVEILVSLGKPTVPPLPTDYSPERYSHLLSERTLKEKRGDAVWSDDIPNGGVVSTEPAPGETVNVGSEVTVFLSKGPAPVKVPDVVGMSIDEAKKVLSDAGLKVQKSLTEQFDADADAKEVLDVTPKVGTGLERDSEVTLTVNNGIEVPDVTGMTEKKAKKKLDDAGLVVADIRVDKSSSRKAGEVERVNPRAGKVVDPNDPRVTIYVSDRAEVPLLLGSSVKEARQKAAEAGLELEVDGDATDDDLVIGQSPRPGKTAHEGDTVSVRAA